MSRSRSPSPAPQVHDSDRDRDIDHRPRSPPPRERERGRSPPRYNRRHSRSRSPPRRDHRGGYNRGRSPHSRSPSGSPRRGYQHHDRHRRSPDRYDDRRRDRFDDRYNDRRPQQRFSRRDDAPRDRRPRPDHPENATPSTVLGVFGLSGSTTKDRLSEIFARFGAVTQLDLIVDRYTNQSKGFGFVYFDDIETATRAREEMNGEMVDGRRVRVDYSLTTKPHDPTPGRYMGRPDQQNDRRSNPNGRSHSGHRESREPREPRGYDDDRR